MSAFIPTDFTKQARDTKVKLDKFFCIVAREEALRIIEDMRNTVQSGKYFEKLADKQVELLRVMKTIPQYVNDHHKVSADKVRYAVGLISDFSPECVDEIEEALDTYEEYAYMLKGIDSINNTIDAEFLQELNRIYSEYRSSTDHMTRLVRRLLRYNFGKSDEYINQDTTRVLILKQFIKQFGYDCEGIRCEALEAVVNEYYDGDVDKIDDSIFDLISQPQATGSDGTESVSLSDEYVDSLTKLQDTIRIKAPLIYVTKEICSKLCEVMSDWVLSKAAIDGTAVLLSDCFADLMPYYEIGIEHIKDYAKLESTEKLDDLNEMLRKRYSRGYYLYTDFSYSVRLYALLKYLADEITITRKLAHENLLKAIQPQAFVEMRRAIGQQYKLSSVFSPENVDYVNFESFENKEKYVKLVKAIEKIFFETGEDLKIKKSAIKKRYAAILGKAYEDAENKTLGKPINYENYPDAYRLMVLSEDYSDVIPATFESIKFLSEVYPGVEKLSVSDGKYLSDVLSAEFVGRIKSATGKRLANNNESLRRFIVFSERFAEDKAEYSAKLRERIEARYNNASKINVGTDFVKNRKTLFSLCEEQVNDYVMLEIADCLANAEFSSQGKTREYLYIFAIAFDIRPVENGNPLRVCDVEKNLFWDYYTDNIVNHLPLVAGLGDSDDTVVDGYGINYKNFAEVIFLWCLNRSDMTAKDRLQKAYSIIKHCKENGKTQEELNKSVNRPQDCMTGQYKDDFEYALLFSQEKFTSYVIENYACKSNNSGMMQINDEQRTAALVIAEQEDVVNSLLDKVEKTIWLSRVTTTELEDALSKDRLLDFFYEYNYLTSTMCRKCPKRSADAFPYCKEYFEPFELKTSSAYESKKLAFENCRECFEYLGLTAEEKKNMKAKFMKVKGRKFSTAKERFEATFTKVNDLCEESQVPLQLLLNRIQKRLTVKISDGVIRFKNVSRSTIMAICFYQFVLINWLKRSADIETCFGNFEKFYDVFVNGDVFTINVDCTDYSYDDDSYDEDYDFEDSQAEVICYRGANEILEQAGYAPVNCKSIFDIYLIYIAYRDNFLPLYTDPIEGFVKEYEELYAQYKKLKKRGRLENSDS